ncbi:GH1 family beta-glucosidase [Thalassotalea sp. G2M2-11]|uniref:GH1 family beta-glucosidase n=1 Tax=Thalassotalea sp. G2M2-11 TaxID=2787627 RepID=UPI0019D257D1|nr:GH1 family beta-glucosidase [Thalassotalea sp. G2M2-11]
MKLTLPINSPMRSPQFTYGIATASFQIEGGIEHRLPCIWDTFCSQPGTIADNSNGAVACDHYNLWQQDIEMIKDLNVDAYRLSIAWGRVMNEDGSINHNGIEFYQQILDKLKQYNIKAFVTLYHWDLPQHLEDNGGWLNRATAYAFQHYVEQIVKAFGDRVYSYATLNEPFCSAYLGYELGIHAPGLKGKEYGKKAAHHLLLAHGLAMQVLKKLSPNTLNGIVLNFTPAYAISDNDADIKAAKYADDYLNQWYIKPIIDGQYPAIISQLDAEHQPEILDDDLAIISQPIDFMGINYYTRAIYQADEDTIYQEIKPCDVELTDMGWEVFPQGFSDVLISLNKTYDLPPIYITENGAAMKDQNDKGEVNDVDRFNYFQSHLLAVNTAIEAGVDIKGYFAWSLMDNFEWAEGYLKRFGLVYVDYQTQKRTIKNSGHAFSQLIGSRK